MPWTGERLALIGLGAVISVAAGATLGLDAGRNVDGFYRTMPGVRYASVPPPSQPVVDEGWTTYPVAAAPQPDYAARRAEIEAAVATAPGIDDAWGEEPRAVRVRRASRSARFEPADIAPASLTDAASSAKEPGDATLDALAPTEQPAPDQA